MFSVFSRSCSSLSFSSLRTAASWLVVALALSGCATGWKTFDNLIQSSPEQETQAVPAPKKAQKPASKTAINKAAPSSGGAASRLASQPWPSTMGQPYPQGGASAGVQTAMAGVPPQPELQQGVQQQPLRSGKTQVALLLPLSGKHAPLGQAMLNAAQMAVFDVAPPNFELMPRDTGAAGGAENAARDAIASGAQLLIGPLLAPDVTAVKPVVQTSNVNMLALSTDVSLAESGVYVMGFAPAPQVERVVDYASRRGISRFAAVIPETAYGKLVRQAFEQAVRKQNGTIAAIEPPSRIQALAAKKDQFEALLLPLGGEELRLAVSQLAANSVDRNKVRLLGTGLWDEPGLGSRHEMLVGGWYAAAEPAAREQFVTQYKQTYGQEPPRLATLTYDATSLAAVLAAHGRRYDRTALTSPSGFAGIDGLFRLTRDGLAERGLAVNELTVSGSVAVDPAPSVFAGAADVYR